MVYDGAFIAIEAFPALFLEKMEASTQALSALKRRQKKG